MKKKSETPEETQVITHDASSPPSILAMMQQMVSSGVTAETPAMLKQFIELSEHMEDREAKKSFARAFVRLQGDISGITANKIVPTKQGGTKYKYASYEEIMEAVKPALAENGFSISFNTRMLGDGRGSRVISECTLLHEDGHAKTNEFPCTIGSGPPDASPAQADGAAATYAQRFALCKMLNIVIETDDDAGARDVSVSAEQAEQFRQRVIATKSDESRFLKFAGAASYEEIPLSKVGELDKMLRGKEGK